MLEKQVQLLRVSLEESDGHKRYLEMVNRVKEAESRASELQRELKHMERLTLEQGKALEKITNENDMPAQLRNLREKLRLQRDKNRELEERLKREERNNIALTDRMVGLEQQNRGLKSSKKEQTPAEDDFDVTLV
jgi:hypothetical protein